VVFEILLALADGERHGYAILKEVEARTGGALRLLPGSLYRAVSRLLAAGLVEETGGRGRAEGDDPRRRYYRLTRRGREAAADEARRLAGALAAARSKRLLRGPERA
jgi:DNA-binding PadR family transcriptional regulator